MNRTDGRALSRTALEERQRTIIRMKENGKCATEISAATGCSIKTVYSLWTKYLRCTNKKSFFTIRARGNKTGNGRTLTVPQEHKIKKIITDKYPDQLRFDFALWTREAVRLLIKKVCGVDMPIRTVGEYLRRWGFTPQRPIKHSCKRDELRIKKWLKNEYPAIKRKAGREKAAIYWGDETTIEASDIRGRGYAPQGRTPVVKNTMVKVSVSMISAITNQGKVFFKLHSGTIDAEKFLDFVKRLIRHKREKIVLILDNAKVHHSRLLTDWLEANRKKIEFFFIPPYSPDLNPDEHINADVKHGVGSRVPRKTVESLSEATAEHMNMLKRTPSRIRAYFLDKNISYAS